MSAARDTIAEQQVNGQSCSVLNADLAMLLCLEAWGFPGPTSSTVLPGAGWTQSGANDWKTLVVNWVPKARDLRSSS